MENLNSILQQIQNTRTKALSDLQLLIEEANFKKKLQQNIQSHPSAWALASAAAGFFLSKLLFRKKKKTKNFNYQPNFKTP
ncbi:MAG: hypothetical protein NZL93_05625, partial [Chthoniobacterales bacterium]|nr:hypothetical protein [Chthoniobacterales bacterium]